jgi:hypothetical protein
MSRSSLPAAILVSIAAAPVAVALVAARAIGQGLEELGRTSEEIFRGDRLPILHFPAEPIERPEIDVD